MAVLDGGSTIAITALVFVAYLAKLLVDIRKSWHEGSLAKEQRKYLVKKAQLAVGKKPKKGKK